MNVSVMLLAIMAVFLLAIGAIVVLTFPRANEIRRFFHEWKSEISQAQGKDKIAHVMLAAAPVVLVLGIALSFIL